MEKIKVIWEGKKIELEKVLFTGDKVSGKTACQGCFFNKIGSPCLGDSRIECVENEDYYIYKELDHD